MSIATLAATPPEPMANCFSLISHHWPRVHVWICPEAERRRTLIPERLGSRFFR